MCYSRRNNKKINKLHEKCLPLIYSDKKSSYEKLIEKDGSVSIHYRNKIFTKIFSDLFIRREKSSYNLRRHPEFRVPLTRTVHHGRESISYLGPTIWDILPTLLKEAVSLNSFKKLIKKWVPQACPCRLCKNYITGVGFVESLT